MFVSEKRVEWPPKPLIDNNYILILWVNNSQNILWWRDFAPHTSPILGGEQKGLGGAAQRVCARGLIAQAQPFPHKRPAGPAAGEIQPQDAGRQAQWSQ